jgi:hypothetical protein
MGGKGSDGPQYTQQQINEQAYAYGQQGVKWVDFQADIPFGHDQALQSWMAGQQAGGSHAGSHGGFEFSFGGSHGGADAGGGADAYAEAIAQQTADLAQQEEERRRIEGQNRRDALYSDYLDAAGSATDYINSQISSELANAQLLGIDYAIDDEQKQTRINDYFGSIWGEGQQGELEALMKEWGNPAGFSGFTVVRGSGETLQSAEGGEETIAVSRGIKPTIVSEEEDQLLGGGPSVLGV